MATLRESFEAKVDRTGEHHLWLGSRTASGHGQIRSDGRLRTAAQVAWELEHGPLPVGGRLRGCVDEASCVRIDHLSVREQADDVSRSKRGGGSIARLGPNRWKLTIDAGRDEKGRRRRLSRTVNGTKTQASQALAALTIEIAGGTTRPAPRDGSCTVDELVEWYLLFAAEVRGLEHSTLVGYRDVYCNWLAGEIGGRRADRIHPADLDNVFGRMRSAGLSYSRMNNGRALLSGAYKWGRRHHKVGANPVMGFELPTSTQAPKAPAAPEIAELLLILSGADEHDSELAPVIKLAATTGMRRGELAGLRRDRLHLDRHELLVDTAVNDAGGTVVIKPTKTKQNRTVSLDTATVDMLIAHLREMDRRAALVGAEVAPDGFVFSLDFACATPMRPEYMTRRMRQLRKQLGVGARDFDATILALRKWTSSELMDAGFNPSTVSGRQGHTVQVMLQHYSSRRRSADRAAADHLGRQVHGQVEE